MSHTLPDSYQRDALPGLKLEMSARPQTAEELGDLLKECTADSRSVLPFGGCGSIRTGCVVPGFDLGIDTRSLTGVIEYQPADLTLSVRAGTTMSEIAAVLGETGQELPIDVPFPDETTVGGLAATGFAGPRKLLSGNLKDAIIGCEYVRGDGLIAKAGGMVVKNVSGFEIPRLLHGSWGALAVLTTINLKVTPRPRSEATVRALWEHETDAIKGMHELASRLPSLAASAIDAINGQVSTSCRVMGREEAVAAIVAEMTTFLGSDVTVIENEESREFWQNHVDRWTPPDAGTQIVIGVRPRDVATVIASIQGLIGMDTGGTDLSIAPGLGTIRIRVGASDTDLPVWPLSRIPGLPAQASGILEAGPESLRQAADPWGPRPQGHALMVAIKHQFDPANVLNRGRLFI